MVHAAVYLSMYLFVLFSLPVLLFCRILLYPFTLPICHTEFWSKSLPFSQEGFSMPEKLDWQFSLPVYPGHL